MTETLRTLVDRLSPFRSRDERGASAVEYGLLVAGIAAVIVGVVFFLGGNITGAFSDTCTKVGAKVSGDGTSKTCEDAPATTP
ncbi:Flp family type IVb pilin [uncultured Nocardioides sp.]|uniref:Flp family type IVb pilin n=1 Tax=uncultured Nocardioides sp. TaxID=198441 RepID=UPI0026260D06|nr:Flp family type IVb pilin [uncultured Nocardioides sp.]